MKTLMGQSQVAKESPDLDTFLRSSFLKKLERRLKEWRPKGKREEEYVIPKPPDFFEGSVEIEPLISHSLTEVSLSRVIRLKGLSGEIMGCIILHLKEDEGLYSIVSGECSLVCAGGELLRFVFKTFSYSMVGGEKTGIEFTAVSSFRWIQAGKWWREPGF